MNAIRLLLCQNDDNGNLSRTIWQASVDVFGDHCMTLEPVSFMDYAVVDYQNDRILEVYGSVVKFSSMVQYAGNIKWNMYLMPEYYAIGFIQTLQRSKKWTCTDGWTELYKKFNSGFEITGKDFGLDEDVQPMIVNPNQLELGL